MWYVYILKSKKDNSLYTGYTNDLKRRFVEHNKGLSTSTKHKTPFELVYYESYRARSDAKRREYALKNHPQAMVALKKRIHDSLTKPISG
ncbi:MAG: GIY-YIG nuclease family protein [Parcubacteria group bacterium]|nr:GIY-YIG nuclease family protein [Parcubacteria group bacterium]